MVAAGLWISLGAASAGAVLPDAAVLPASAVAGEELAPPAETSLGAPAPEAPSSDDKRGHKHPAPTLPTFTGVATVGRTRYSFTMVGTNPELRRAKNVVVPVLIIPLRFEFSDGTVLDPSQSNACLAGLVPLTLALQSPLFQDFDYGEGPKQFLEQIRRLEFWQFTAPGSLNPGYSVRLSPSVLPTMTVALSPDNGTTQEVPCITNGGVERSGRVDVGELPSQVTPQLAKMGVNASTFVLFLVYNVAFTAGGSTIGIFHSVLPLPGGPAAGPPITYAVAGTGYVDQGNLVHLAGLSHEFAEWLDDPFVTNQTPPWGHIGQARGCQANLEVGDPLTGTYLPPVQMPNGFSYQLQETAFFSWFFDQVPSPGFSGWYSSGGTFRSPAAPCQ